MVKNSAFRFSHNLAFWIRPNGSVRHFQPSGFLFIWPSCHIFGPLVFYLSGPPDSAYWTSPKRYLFIPNFEESSWYGRPKDKTRKNFFKNLWNQSRHLDLGQPYCRSLYLFTFICLLSAMDKSIHSGFIPQNKPSTIFGSKHRNSIRPNPERTDPLGRIRKAES